ncbi:hypothetical protein G3N59_21020 [Paraburkholderia sp. Ac-20340]|uniref:hypothetical protein n=1 Tax=Paraburkholderia sp. Ac-20340 TaxID=2703888 RepID=UPI00197D56C4|nr:hypothetical protein [Paraburkholderia sp. Ac-20340]MBN3855865.1 hypothetical protein [Paraburkholderia sp. Ac-20340]
MRVNPKDSSCGPANGGRLPANLADAELDHVERMVQYMSRAQAAQLPHSPRGIDGEYWKKRLHKLESTYDLVATQRSRVARLLEILNGADVQSDAAATARNAFAF